MPVAVGAIAVLSVHEQKRVQALGGRPPDFLPVERGSRERFALVVEPAMHFDPSPIRAHGRSSARATCQVFGSSGIPSAAAASTSRKAVSTSCPNESCAGIARQSGVR